MTGAAVLHRSRAVVFDLDGVVWHGADPTPGAADLIAALGRAGRGVAFLSNNSRATATDIRTRLGKHGIAVDPDRVLTPLDVIGDFIRERHGPSRVLVIGADEMGAAIRAAGHELLPLTAYRDATVVAVGNDFDLSYTRLAAAARAVAAGAALVTPNVDARLPVEGGDFLPGCGAIVEAVAVAGGRRPEIVGKPEPTLFRVALSRLGTDPGDTVMVGDSLESDIQGGRGVGMRTVLYAPDGRPAVSPDLAPDLVVRSFAELGAALLSPAHEPLRASATSGRRAR